MTVDMGVIQVEMRFVPKDLEGGYLEVADLISDKLGELFESEDLGDTVWAAESDFRMLKEELTPEVSSKFAELFDSAE